MLKAFAGGFNFAHFAGLGRSSKNAGNSDLRDQPEGEAAAAAAAAETEECEEEEEEEEEMAAGGKKGKKAKKKADPEDGDGSDGEEDGDDDEDEDEDEEGEDKNKGGKKATTPKAKPAAKSGGDFKRGRKAERRRIGLILSHPAAAANLAFACKLACNTGMSSAAAIALLEQTPAAPAGRGGRLDRQMTDAKVPTLKAGAPAETNDSAAIARSWEMAGAAYHPKKG